MRRLALVAVLAASSVSSHCRSISGSTSSPREMAPATGLAARYHGHAKTPRATRLAVSLDLARVAGEGELENTSYRGFLRVAAGGFASHEYATFYFADVRFDDATGALSFGGGPTDIKLQGARLADGTLRADLTSSKEQATLPIELGVFSGNPEDAPGFASLPKAGHLTGHYVANCGERHEALQIEASRWRGEQDPDPTVFGGYKVFGRRGQFDEIVCGSKTQACTIETYPDARVQFLARTVTLGGRNATPCKIVGSRIACTEGCSFAREADVAHTVLDQPRDAEIFERMLTLTEEDGKPDVKGRGGQYYGYLHHEGRDVYQLVALNVRAAQRTDTLSGERMDGEFVAAVATLYFGEGDSSEYIAYRFKETVASGNATGMVLDGDGEGLLVVNDWSGKTIRGTWYGKSYGRVGTVELTRDIVPQRTAETQLLQSVAGQYSGEGWDFELATSANLSESPADFYPLKIFGWAKERLLNSKRRSIEDGAFDFYTGTIALRLNDGRTVLGTVGNRGMELHWAPVPRLGAPLTTAEYKTFKKVSDKSMTQALLDQQD